MSSKLGFWFVVGVWLGLMVWLDVEVELRGYAAIGGWVFLVWLLFALAWVLCAWGLNLFVGCGTPAKAKPLLGRLHEF